MSQEVTPLSAHVRACAVVVVDRRLSRDLHCIFGPQQNKLDWANSAPTYPQTGHHSRHRFWSGIFKNIITHYYMNFSTSIYSVYIFQGRWCIPRRRIHNSNYIFNLPAMITLNLFSKYLNDWWLNVHSKIIIPKEYICFYICWQIKYYF